MKMRTKTNMMKMEMKTMHDEITRKETLFRLSLQAYLYCQLPHIPMRSPLLLSILAVFIAVLIPSLASAAPAASVKFNGNTYYKVEGNNKAMDTGDEVCKSIGQSCIGFKSINTNSICKLFHPNAKEITSFNGSKAGFYCDGAPQKGLACAPYKNTCQVCPNCNLNEAASCSTPIGDHFREMYVWRGKASSSAKSSVKSSVRSSVKSSARKSSTARSRVPLTTSKKPLYGPMPMPSAANATNMKKAPGVLCQHGGDCQSGMCLGVVPGREYRCSCNDPKTRWQSCVK